MMKFATKYTYKSPKGVSNEKPSKTCSEFAAECDINSIMRRYDATGVLCDPYAVNGQLKPAVYCDVSDIADYQTACNAVIAAQDSFAKLPAKVRARFANDPANLMEFVADDANYDEAVKLGLIAPKTAKIEDSVTVEQSAVDPTPSNAPTT